MPRHAAYRRKSKTGVHLALVAVFATTVGVLLFFMGANNTAPASATSNVKAFSVSGVAPSSGSTVSSAASIRIAFSNALAKKSPLPSISPSVPGKWVKLSPSTIEFVQQAVFPPGQQVHVTIPGGKTGIRAVDGKTLARTTTASFQMMPMTILEVQELLARLNYLPVAYSPNLGDSPSAFTPRWPNLPPALMAQWTPGVDNVITKGAVMQFEAVHNMTTDGVAGPQVWTQLLADAEQGKLDPNPYNYVYVSEALPETLTLYSNGAVIYTAKVNTGVAAAPTNIGTFPVYVRYQTQTMSGTNPDGSHYSDPGIPWVSYFSGGDALHGFIRSSYGFPQSVGCVEMAFADAQAVWPHTPIGTLVTVAPA